MKDLHGHLQRGLLWTGLQHWGVHVIRLGVLFALARFIGPVSFGVYTLATTLVSIAQLLANSSP
jgi:O-antigen/teichoic acid export membrane protein